jgi:hypothetical protein
MITEIIDAEGNKQTSQKEIRKTFHGELQARFAPIPVTEDSVEQIYSTINQTTTTEMGETLDAPITHHELYTAISQAPKHKSPGEDGITAEFYQWERTYYKKTCCKCITIFYSYPIHTETGYYSMSPKE